MLKKTGKLGLVNTRNYEVLNGELTQEYAVGAGGALENFDSLGEYGQFMLSLSLETFKNPISEGGLYSGLSTIGSTVQACIDYGTDAAVTDETYDIHYYATYSAVLSLEPSTRTWQISS